MRAAPTQLASRYAAGYRNMSLRCDRTSQSDDRARHRAPNAASAAYRRVTPQWPEAAAGPECDRSRPARNTIVSRKDLLHQHLMEEKPYAPSRRGSFCRGSLSVPNPCPYGYGRQPPRKGPEAVRSAEANIFEIAFLLIDPFFRRRDPIGKLAGIGDAAHQRAHKGS